eukprot:g5534.t1
MSGPQNNNNRKPNSTVAKLLTADDKKQGKIIEQLAESRKKMSQRLSEANKYISYLERRMEESNRAMYDAFHVTEKVREMTVFLLRIGVQVLDELDALSCLTVATAASLKFGVDEDEAINKLSSLQKRISLAQESLTEERKFISVHCPRKIPVSWIGVAQDVKVMGDFDGWTRGKDLYADEISEHVISEFTGVLELLPGEYQIKFLVNEEWKLASSWPVITNSNGVTNNLLIVE